MASRHNARLMEFMAAFEEGVATDDWSQVAALFTEDAVYETNNGPPFGGRREGRDAILAFIKRTVDEFDRRFDTRGGRLLEGPTEKDGGSWIKWEASYSVGDSPTLVLVGEEWAFFEEDGDRIRHLEDFIPDEVNQRIAAWMKEHGAKLKPAPPQR